MDTFKIDTSSWHYRLNAYMNDDPYKWRHHHSDFCSYWRGTVWSITKLFLVFVLVVLILSWFAFTAYTAPLLMLGLVVGIPAVFFSVVWIQEHFKNRKRRDKGEPSTLVGKKYRSWKDKYCPLVEYEIDD